MDQMVLYGTYFVVVLFSFCMPSLVVVTTFEVSRKATDQMRNVITLFVAIPLGLLTICNGFNSDMVVTDILIAFCGYLGFLKAYADARKQIAKLLVEAQE